MARDKDFDSASAGAQSKRPPLNHRDSDSQSDTTNTSGATAHQHRTKVHQKQHHVGRLHARVPSSKAVHKHVSHGHAHPHGGAKLNRRPGSPTDQDSLQRPAHRRATSEVKLPSRSSTSNLPKSASHSSLKRNRSHVEVGKRNRSSDKLKRTSSGTGIHGINKSSKTQVHFDLGSDDPEDEWVDASGSNSPYLSRKGSLNSSAQSSLRPGGSANSSRPDTPSGPAQAQAPHSSPDRERYQRKEYLTSRLLQRTPSHGAPPKMTADIAQATRSHQSSSPNSTDPNVSPPLGANDDELTSRFVDTPGSGVTSEGSFYHAARGAPRRSMDSPARSISISNLPQDGLDPVAADKDNSALVPKPARRTAALPAETSRVQQKLNLQRASSVLEPSQGVPGIGGAVGASPLIGVGGPGFDGGSSRDPRVGKMLERTGMEYLVVRRYQNPVARSLNRLGRLPDTDKNRRIPRAGTPSVNGKRSTELPSRHTRNVSMPDPRQTAIPKHAPSVRTSGAGSSFEGDEVSRLNERLSGSSLVGVEDEDGTTTLLRNLWEKSMELSASTD
ncbi:multidrug resistance-associated 1 [Purpureocillium lavendulum]|uniref:Multidrug resistance-associated 1 n=1 Tax=Purpureocillium lavendulum TaxID=1247861 RepID=A0AB34FM17_9HYPO|nr:multidrug resistance-associated 1 [Purpureocillium lavendulum]